MMRTGLDRDRKLAGTRERERGGNEQMEYLLLFYYYSIKW
jgi:hypothetical protein